MYSLSIASLINGWCENGAEMTLFWRDDVRTVNIRQKSTVHAIRVIGAPQLAVSLSFRFQGECNNNTASSASCGGSDVDSAEASVCTGCGSLISDRYFLMVANKQWHVDCLRCSQCQQTLHCDLTCFTRDGEIYCREDYTR